MGIGLMVGSKTACTAVNLVDLNNSNCKYRPSKTVNVSTYNIANARGDTDNFFKRVKKAEQIGNLERIVGFAKQEDLDVLCMNEVDFNSHRTDFVNQAKYLAKKLCFNHVLEDRYVDLGPALSMGNAVISKFPIKVNKVVRYGDSTAERFFHMFKGYVDFTTGGIDYILTHFDAESEVARIEEAQIVIEHLKTKKGPFVLLGDFNAEPGSQSLNSIIYSGYIVGPPSYLKTYPCRTPRKRIDHILVSPDVRLKNYRSTYVKASDHRPVVGKILI